MNLRRPIKTTTGWVNQKAMIRSMTVVRPRMKANPRTLPMDRKYNTTAASSVTKSAANRVRRARTHPLSQACRRDRPSRSSSRMRSKYTMKESAVMPTATIAPATPARVRVSPMVLEKITTNR